MNRNLGIFLGTVALAAAGGIIGSQLTASDLANAAPRSETITRKGSTATIETVTFQRVTESDGGVRYTMRPSGYHIETASLDDGGTEDTQVTKDVNPCNVPAGTQAENAVENLFTGAALVCYRRGVRLER